MPAEIRNKIYDELLVHITPIFLDTNAWSRQPSIFGTSDRYYSTSLRLYPAILLLNKNVHEEASSILYSRNHFEIEDTALLALFLNKIGPHNAAFLHHLIIWFPQLGDNGDLAEITLHDEGLRMLHLIHEKCQNIRILSLRVRRIDEVLLNAFDTQAIDQELASLNAQLKAIPSPRDIRIQVCIELIDPNIQEKMKDYGWIAAKMKDDRPHLNYDPYEDYEVYDACDAYYHY